MKIKTKDEVVRRVIAKIDERSIIGQQKYGDTMMSEVNSGKKDLKRFMVDVQEELTDMLLYLEAARECLQQEIEECYINDKHEPVVLSPTIDNQIDLEEEIRERRMDIIGQNGNDGEHYGYIPAHDGYNLDNDLYWKSDRT